MLIYHTHCQTCSNREKGYKSGVKRGVTVNRGKSTGSNGPKRIKTSTNKKLTDKNKQFLEGLGLKVKQSIENC